MYLIDGYNLLYQTHFVAREDLVQALDEYCRALGKQAIVVFDGLSPDDLSTDNVKVEFGDNADARLMELMDQYRGGATLISSDNELQHAARQKKVGFLKSEKFIFEVPPEAIVAPGEESDLDFSDDEVSDMMEEFNGFKK